MLATIQAVSRRLAHQCHLNLLVKCTAGQTDVIVVISLDQSLQKRKMKTRLILADEHRD